MRAGSDPIALLARQRIIKLSAELEAQLSFDGGGPVVEIWRRLRERACKALTSLATETELFTEKGRAEALALQNEVKRYDEYAEILGEILAEGMQYDAEMEEEERRELLDIVMATPEGARAAEELGLIESENADVA